MRTHTAFPAFLLLAVALFFTLFVWLDQQPVHTQTEQFQPFQITNYHSQPISGYPSGFTAFDGAVYFGVNGGSYYDLISSSQDGLWKTDGTDAGTTLVKNFNLEPNTLVRSGDALWFRVWPATLWRSDGTAEGTVLLQDYITGTISLTDLTTVGTVTYFAADDGTHGWELWQSDGTPEGTVLVYDAMPGVEGSHPRHFVGLGNLLYYVADAPEDGTPRLWMSDGTAAGTMIVPDIPAEVFEIALVGDILFLSGQDAAAGRELWRYDDSDAGATLVRDIVPGADSAQPKKFLEFANQLFFVTQTDAGQVLWRSDGTTDGTQLVWDAVPTSETETLVSFTATDQFLYFEVYDTRNYRDVELWRVDGATAIPTLIETYAYDESAAPVYYIDDSPYQFVAEGDLLYFLSHDNQLWKIDDTATEPTEIATAPVNFVAVIDGALYLSLYDEAVGYELGYSDGTAAGIQLVKDIENSYVGVSVPEVVTANERIFAVVTWGDSLIPEQLWMSEGLTAPGFLLDDTYESYDLYAAGTNVFVSARTGITEITETLLFIDQDEQQLDPLHSADSIRFAQALGDQVFFFVRDYDSDTQSFWRSDGTTAGTIQLIDELSVGSFYYHYGPETFVIADHVALLNQQTIWRTDGTRAGTTSFVVSELDLSGFVTFLQGDERVYIYYNDSIDFREGFLWRSDGTEAGTVRLSIDAFPEIRRAQTTGTGLYVVAGGDLWYHDGTSTEIVRLTTGFALNLDQGADDFEIVGEQLYFVRSADKYGSELWKSDGTVDGTAMVRRIVPIGGDAYPGPELFSHQSTLLYSANDEEIGWELWQSDGTESGTVLLKDIRPGPDSSLPEQLISGDTHFFFTAFDEEHGRELWQSDGTTDGTQLAVDLYPGRASSYLRLRNWQDGALFFSGENGTDGDQLYTFSATAPAALPPIVEPPPPGEYAHQIYLPHLQR